VSAASSLTDVLQSLGPEAESAAGAKVLFNFGSSGSLRKQIEEGAPADVFFPAAAEDMDRLAGAGLLAPDTRRDLLSNSLVLVGDKSTKKPRDVSELSALLAAARLVAVGNPDSVPAGRYAVQAFKSLGLQASTQGKLVLAGSAREALQFAESASAPLAVVFRTDAATLGPRSSLTILFEFPASALATPILYPVAVVAASRNRDSASKLVDFLAGKAAREAFAKAGFDPR
jgi:molybdate transport system substrate-binding protein